MLCMRGLSNDVEQFLWGEFFVRLRFGDAIEAIKEIEAGHPHDEFEPFNFAEVTHQPLARIFADAGRLFGDGLLHTECRFFCKANRNFVAFVEAMIIQIIAVDCQRFFKCNPRRTGVMPMMAQSVIAMIEIDTLEQAEFEHALRQHFGVEEYAGKLQIGSQHSRRVSHVLPIVEHEA